MFTHDLFIERLIKLRRQKGLTQPELGKIMNISKQAVNEIEKGRNKISIDKLVLLAEFFNVSLDYLVGRDELGHKEEKSLSADQNELLSLYNSLNDFSKGILIENARIMMEKQPKKAQ